MLQVVIIAALPPHRDRLSRHHPLLSQCGWYLLHQGSQRGRGSSLLHSSSLPGKEKHGTGWVTAAPPHPCAAHRWSLVLARCRAAWFGVVSCGTRGLPRHCLQQAHHCQPEVVLLRLLSLSSLQTRQRRSRGPQTAGHEVDQDGLAAGWSHR